jgi:hypothetical protein
MALVVVASKPFVWKRDYAAATIRFRIASLFCARRPTGRFTPAAALRDFVFPAAFFFIVIEQSVSALT